MATDLMNATCSACDEPLPSSRAKFCSFCGESVELESPDGSDSPDTSHTDTQDIQRKPWFWSNGHDDDTRVATDDNATAIIGDPDETQLDESFLDDDDLTSVAQVPLRRGSWIRRHKAVVAASVVGLCVAGASAYGLLRDTSLEIQFASSATALDTSLQTLGSTSSSKQVRDLAATAQSEVTSIDSVMSADPDGDGADELKQVRAPLVLMASLKSYDTDNTRPWKKIRSEFATSVNALNTLDEFQQADPSAASKSMDSLTSKSDRAMRKWRAAVSRNESRLAQAVGYESAMRSLMTEYSELRNDTGDFVQYVKDEEVYMSEIFSHFRTAASDRRSVRDRMSGLDVPPALADSHSQVVYVLSDGIDGIESALDGLSDADCYFGSCYFNNKPEWQQFLSESDRITEAYSAAVGSWNSGVARNLDSIRAARPDKPVI